MTKQEEIREKILYLIAEPLDETMGELTDKIIKYLDSQGVVIKVDRECDGHPECTGCYWHTHVEPLI